MNRRTTCRLAVVCLLALFATPSVLHATEKPAPEASVVSPQRSQVNVNTAGVQELTTLPGIGPALAERIVALRKESGPFRRAEDLLAVRGIGPKLLDKIRDRLSFETPGTPR